MTTSDDRVALASCPGNRANDARSNAHELVPELDAFIREELARHADGFSGQGRPETGDGGEVRGALHELFRLTLREAWATSATGQR